MRGTVSPYEVTLKPKQRKRLEAVIRRRSPEHWMVERAKIVMLSHQGVRIVSICSALSLDRQLVRRWLKRYLEDGFDGLKDRGRSGRPNLIDNSVWTKLATIVVQSPEKFGLPFARWSVRALEEFMLERYDCRVSRSSISRFLRSMALKPHRVRYWLNPTDPDFDKKAARICKLYVSPPRDATVLSLDEKPGIQALRRTHPTRPMDFEKPTRIEYEYERKGTRNVFAAFNIKTGLGYSGPSDTERARLPRPSAAPVSTRSGDHRHRQHQYAHRRARACVAGQTPESPLRFHAKHGSWLNQVEIWFGILTSKALRARSFESVNALAKAIYRFAKHWNDALAHPFEWTYTGKALHA